MFGYEEDPSRFAIQHTTVAYAREYDPTTLMQAQTTSTTTTTARYDAYMAKSVEMPTTMAPTSTSIPAPALSQPMAEGQYSQKRAGADKVLTMPYQTIMEREVHVRMPVQDVLNKQITVTCAHANCQNSIRTCHFHTCPHCGEDKRYAETMCIACTRDPKRSTAKAGMNPAAQVYLPNIPESSVQRIRCVGGGTHSAVHECLYDGLSACEKVLLKNDPTVLLEEARVMAQVDRHPNILRIYGVCQRSNGETSIIMELMQYDLLDILKSFQRHVPKGDMQRVVPNLVDYIFHAANGLRHMHRHGVIHRDVAARNMLFGNDVIKVADFGLAKCVSNRTTQGLPKPLSTAPECIRDLENPNLWIDKSDVWSFGLMICEVFDLGTDPLEQFHHSVPALMDALDRGWVPKRPALCPDSLWDLALRCFRLKPHERPSMEEITNAIMMHRISHPQDVKVPTKSNGESKPSTKPSMVDNKREFFEMPPGSTPAAMNSQFVPFTTGHVDQMSIPDTKAWVSASSFPGMPSTYHPTAGMPESMVDESSRHASYDMELIRGLQSPIDIPPHAAAAPRAARKSDMLPHNTTTATVDGLKARAETRSFDSTEISKNSTSVALNSTSRNRTQPNHLSRPASLPASNTSASTNSHVSNDNVSRGIPTFPRQLGNITRSTMSHAASYHPTLADPNRRGQTQPPATGSSSFPKAPSNTSPRASPDYANLTATFY